MTGYCPRPEVCRETCQAVALGHYGAPCVNAAAVQRMAQVAEQEQGNVGLYGRVSQQQALDCGPCPLCGATPGRSCRRPSGKLIKDPHAARYQLADDMHRGATRA